MSTHKLPIRYANTKGCFIASACASRVLPRPAPTVRHASSQSDQRICLRTPHSTRRQDRSLYNTPKAPQISTSAVSFFPAAQQKGRARVSMDTMDSMDIIPRPSLAGLPPIVPGPSPGCGVGVSPTPTRRLISRTSHPRRPYPPLSRPSVMAARNKAVQITGNRSAIDICCPCGLFDRPVANHHPVGI